MRVTFPCGFGCYLLFICTYWLLKSCLLVRIGGCDLVLKWTTCKCQMAVDFQFCQTWSNGTKTLEIPGPVILKSLLNCHMSLFCDVRLNFDVFCWQNGGDCLFSPFLGSAAFLLCHCKVLIPHLHFVHGLFTSHSPPSSLMLFFVICWLENRHLVLFAHSIYISSKYLIRG